MALLDDALLTCVHSCPGPIFTAPPQANSGLLARLAVAQSADALIGIHGASIANSWFMRPGSSGVQAGSAPPSAWQHTWLPAALLTTKSSARLADVNCTPVQQVCLGWLQASPRNHGTCAAKARHVDGIASCKCSRLPPRVAEWLAQSSNLRVCVACAHPPQAMPDLSAPAVVEVYPPAWLWDVHRRWLEQDPQAQLQWWGLLVKVRKRYRAA